MGVLLDEKLTFETHIDYMCKKACAGVGALRQIKPFCPALHFCKDIQFICSWALSARAKPHS